VKTSLNSLHLTKMFGYSDENIKALDLAGKLCWLLPLEHSNFALM
jgi:hypothetical protein